MIKYTIQKVEQKQFVSLICDVCKKEFDCDKDEDMLEIQEFQHIKILGGYKSIFGDGNKYKIDICQYCLKKMMGEYIVSDEDS